MTDPTGYFNTDTTWQEIGTQSDVRRCKGWQCAHVDVEAVVFGEGHEQLGSQALVQENDASATGHRVAQVQAARPLARQTDQILQPLPLELAPGKQHLRAATAQDFFTTFCGSISGSSTPGF